MTAQAMEALGKANRIRLYRSERKKEIARMMPAAGRAEVAGIIRDNPTDWQTCELWQILQAPRYAGDASCRKWCRLAGVSPQQQVGKLTARQRDQLAWVLER